MKLDLVAMRLAEKNQKIGIDRKAKRFRELSLGLFKKHAPPTCVCLLPGGEDKLREYAVLGNQEESFEMRKW